MKSLRAFEGVARHGTISAAAGALNLTQGAVSHRIIGLERALGVALFRREHNRLTLTSEGHAFLPLVRDTLERLSAGIGELSAVNVAGRLAVHAVPSFLSFWLMPRLPRFCLHHPGIALTCGPIGYEASPSDPVSDVAIRSGDGRWPGVRLRLLAHFDDLPVCSPTFLNASPLRTPSDLETLPLLHSDDGSAWANWLAHAGVTRSAHARDHHFANAHLALQGAINGLGVSLADNITVRGVLDSGALLEPLGMRVPAMSAFYLAMRQGAEELPTVSAFVNWLTVELEDDRPRI